jgi:2-amino-4-hydroxy-6-hydroxymethyldihydropteridine diphosphokinase
VTPIFIGLGSNLGDRRTRIQEAVDLLGERLELTAVSPLYETAPMYVEDQPPFLNGVLAAATTLGPLQVLRLLKEVERKVGRLPRERYGPREIDLDLVAYGQARYEFRDEGIGGRDQGSGTREQGSGFRDQGTGISRKKEFGSPPVLTLPHPRTAERRFVLQPLCDVAPDLVLPGVGAIKKLLDATSDQAQTVMLVTDAVLSLHR